MLEILLDLIAACQLIISKAEMIILGFIIYTCAKD